MEDTISIATLSLATIHQTTESLNGSGSYVGRKGPGPVLMFDDGSTIEFDNNEEINAY